jgi:hypothetical protein
MPAKMVKGKPNDTQSTSSHKNDVTEEHSSQRTTTTSFIHATKRPDLKARCGNGKRKEKHWNLWVYESYHFSSKMMMMSGHKWHYNVSGTTFWCYRLMNRHGLSMCDLG